VVEGEGKIGMPGGLADAGGVAHDVIAGGADRSKIGTRRIQARRGV
jgi:hypothetical protein